MPTCTYAQPGRASGCVINGEPQQIILGARNDGFVLHTKSNLPEKDIDGHLVALFYSPAKLSYHWYRRDTSGLWSHKSGQNIAKNTDDNGGLILDPMESDRGDYTEFLGYFSCPLIPVFLF